MFCMPTNVASGVAQSDRTAAATACHQPSSQRGIDGKPPMPRNRKKKESFNLENGFPNRPLVRL